MDEYIKLLLVEDHPVTLRGLQAIFLERTGIEVSGYASSAREALKSTVLLHPDVVVLPIRLGGTRSGIELCRSIKSVCTAKVVVFTSFTRNIDIQVAILAGADALISKATEPEELVDALQLVASGRRGLLLGQRFTPLVDTRRLISTETLTHRENEILQLVMESHSNPTIASRLGIEVSTVKTHMRNILRKLGVDTRRDLLADTW